MKDYLKNPLLYYVLLPALLLIWISVVFFVYLPEAETDFTKEKFDYRKSQDLIGKILELDPQRIDILDPNSSGNDFDYTSAINKIAGKHGIGTNQYNLRVYQPRKRDKQKIQRASLKLEDIKIITLSKFISSLTLHWRGLECEKIKLTKLDDGPDMWKVDLEFMYYD